MSLKLHELKSDEEFAKIVDVENAGYSEPFNGLWEILKGPSPEELAARQALWHHHGPGSHWLYVTDEDTGEAIGAMEWKVYETNPYEAGPPTLVADWWPEGTLKEISDHVIVEFLKDRPKIMSKPHFLISYCVVRPGHRHRGVASLMMKWGLKKADEMSLETFVESTQDGEGFYKAHGFEVIDSILLDADIPNPSEEFTALRKKLLPVPGFMMFRPVGGKTA